MCKAALIAHQVLSTVFLVGRRPVSKFAEVNPIVVYVSPQSDATAPSPRDSASDLTAVNTSPHQASTLDTQPEVPETSSAISVAEAGATETTSPAEVTQSQQKDAVEPIEAQPAVLVPAEELDNKEASSPAEQGQTLEDVAVKSTGVVQSENHDAIVGSESSDGVQPESDIPPSAATANNRPAEMAESQAISAVDDPPTCEDVIDGPTSPEIVVSVTDEAANATTDDTSHDRDSAPRDTSLIEGDNSGLSTPTGIAPGALDGLTQLNNIISCLSPSTIDVLGANPSSTSLLGKGFWGCLVFLTAPVWLTHCLLAQ